MANIFKRSKNALLALADKAYGAYRPAQQAKSKYFAPVADQVRARDVIREVGANTRNIATQVAQGTARSVPAIGATVATAINPRLPSSVTPSNNLEKFIFGNDPITSYQTSNVAKFAQSKGLNPKAAAAVGLAGGVIENFPGAKFLKKPASKLVDEGLTLLQKLAKEKNGPAISNLLRRDVPNFGKLPVRDRIAAISAFKKVETEQDAKAILDIINPPKVAPKPAAPLSQSQALPKIPINQSKVMTPRMLPDNVKDLGPLVDSSNEQLLEINAQLGDFVKRNKYKGTLEGPKTGADDDVRMIIDMMGVKMDAKRSLEDAAEEAMARVQQSMKRRIKAPLGTQQAFGAAAGIEPEKDEQGNFTGKANINYQNALLGALGTTAASKIVGKGKIPPNAKIVAAAEQLAAPTARKTMPGLEDIKYSSGKSFPKLPPVDQVKAFISDVATKYSNRYSPIEDAVKGKKLKPSQDPTFLLKRLSGGEGIAKAKLDYELSPILKQVDDLDGFRKFLIGNRMTELSQRGIGESGERAIQELMQRNPTQFQKFQQTADQLYSYQLKQLDELRQVGVLSDEAFQTITNANQKYVPFQRVMDEIEGSGFIGGIKDLNVKNTSIKAIKGSEKEIIDPLESIVKNTYDLTKTVEKNRALSALAQIGEFKPIKGANPLFEPKQPHISLYQNGQRVYLETSAEIADAIKGINEEELNLATRILSKPGKMLREGATMYNVAFAIPNLVRDQLSAAVNSKYGGVPIYDFISGLSSVLKQDEAYKNWLSSGADQAGFFSQMRPQLQQTLKDVIAPRWVKNAKTLKNPFEIAKAFGELSEKGSRVGVYKRAMKGAGREGLQGMDQSLMAMRQSREATIDFSEMGSKARAFNSLVPFLNARLQGSKKFIQSVKQRPVQTLAVGGALVSIPSIALYTHNRQYPEYDEIPDYIKDNNFIIMTGDEKTPFYKVPKGEVGKIFGNPVENFLDHAYGKDPKSLMQLTRDLVGELSPIGDTPNEILSAAGPLKMPFELAANYDTFRDQNIVSPFQKDLPPELQFNNKTTETAKFIGDKLKKSPAKIDHIVMGLGGGVGKQLLQGSDAAFFGKLPEKQNAPIFDRFMGEQKDLNKTATKIYEEEEKRKQDVARTNFAVKQRIEKAIETGNQDLLMEAYEANPKSFKQFYNDIIERRESKDLSPEEKAIRSLPKEQQAKLSLDPLPTTGQPKALASGGDEISGLLNDPKLKYEMAKKKFELDEKLGAMSSLDKKARTKELGKLEIQTKYPTGVTEFFGAPQQDIRDYLKESPDKIEVLRNAFKLDDEYLEKGLSSSPKFSKKFRSEFGAKAPTSSSKGIKVRRATGGSAKTKKDKAVKVVKVGVKLRAATKIKKISAPNVKVVKAKAAKSVKLKSLRVKVAKAKLPKGIKRGSRAKQKVRVATRG